MLSNVKKVPGTFCLIGAAWGVTLLGTPNSLSLALRPIANSHEYWRLITGNLIHSNYSHLILDTLGTLVVGYLVEPYLSRKIYSVILLALALLTSLIFLMLYPEASGGGLSAICHGLLGTLVALWYRSNSKGLAYTLVVFLAIKLGLELSGGALLGNSILNSVGAPKIGKVASELHLYIVLCGIIIGTFIPMTQAHGSRARPAPEM